MSYNEQGKLECIGCTREAVTEFFCPCDMMHPICAVHDADPHTRKDCCFTHQWGHQEGIVRVAWEG